MKKKEDFMPLKTEKEYSQALQKQEDLYKELENLRKKIKKFDAEKFYERNKGWIGLCFISQKFYEFWEDSETLKKREYKCYTKIIDIEPNGGFIILEFFSRPDGLSNIRRTYTPYETGSSFFENKEFISNSFFEIKLKQMIAFLNIRETI